MEKINKFYNVVKYVFIGVAVLGLLWIVLPVASGNDDLTTTIRVTSPLVSAGDIQSFYDDANTIFGIELLLGLGSSVVNPVNSSTLVSYDYTNGAVFLILTLLTLGLSVSIIVRLFMKDKKHQDDKYYYETTFKAGVVGYFLLLVLVIFMFTMCKFDSTNDYGSLSKFYNHSIGYYILLVSAIVGLGLSIACLVFSREEMKYNDLKKLEVVEEKIEEEE